jgi:hypothetical protein
MKFSIRHFCFLAAALLMLLLASDACAQCPMCKAALTSSQEGRALSEGFNRGILFLLSVPFLTLALIGFRILRARNAAAPQDKRQKEKGESTDSPFSKNFLLEKQDVEALQRREMSVKQQIEAKSPSQSSSIN